MAIRGYFGPPKRGPRPGPTYRRPSPTMPQAEQRERRHNRLPIVYGGSFSLTEEVAAICSALAVRVAAEPLPLPCTYRDDVAHLADAVHETVSLAVGWIAEAEARKRAANVPAGSRARSVRLLADLAERPPLPEITPDALVSGSWATTLVAITRPYSDALARLLGCSAPPGMVADGGRSRSELLEAALREVDLAALELTKRLRWAAVCREEYAHVLAARAERDPGAQARKELQQLGIDA